MSLRQTAQMIRRQCLTPEFFLSNVLMPLLVLLLLMLLVSWLFPPGMTKAFAIRTMYYLTPVVAFATCIFLALVMVRKTEFRWLRNRQGNFALGDLLLLLFPLTPILQYVLRNASLLSWQDGLFVISLFTAIISVPVLLLPYLLRKTSASEPVRAIGVAFTFLLMDMASLSSQFHWHTTASVKVAWPLLGLLYFVFWLAFQFQRKRLVYLFVVILFLLNSTIQLAFPQDTTLTTPDPDQTRENTLFQLAWGKTPNRTPNIYLLVYDSYPAAEALLGYGLDNHEQEEYLREQGFKIYPRTYSVAAHTIPSMGFMLNSAPTGPSTPRGAAAGNGIVQRLLKNYGYTTYGIFASDYFFRDQEVPSYDFSFPSPKGSVWLLLTKAILEGEFRFDLEFDKVPYERFLQEKASVFSHTPSSPRFIYAHSHFPNHSQNSGACLPNEISLFAERLAIANAEMERDIELILASDPMAIIIVAGDHGPYLTKNCISTRDVYRASEITRLDILDRFSVLLAIRWPSSDFESYDDMIVLQDLFPAIFAYMFEDKAFLQARFTPTTLEKHPISGVSVVNGIIHGGINDGEPLFVGEE